MLNWIVLKVVSISLESLL